MTAVPMHLRIHSFMNNNGSNGQKIRARACVPNHINTRIPKFAHFHSLFSRYLIANFPSNVLFNVCLVWRWEYFPTS